MEILTRQILRVSMNLFCRSTESQSEFMKKIAARRQLRTVYNHETYFFSPLTYWKMVLGTFFLQTTSYVEEKQEENFTYTANAKMPPFT